MTDSESEDVCKSCGKVEREKLDAKSQLKDTVMKQMDELALGVRTECSDCGRRLDPKEHIKIYSDDGEVVADGTDVTPNFNDHLGEYYGEPVVGEDGEIDYITEDEKLQNQGMLAGVNDGESEEVNFLDEGTFRYGMD
jgi:hypothetical protein